MTVGQKEILDNLIDIKGQILTFGTDVTSESPMYAKKAQMINLLEGMIYLARQKGINGDYSEHVAKLEIMKNLFGNFIQAQIEVLINLIKQYHHNMVNRKGKTSNIRDRIATYIEMLDAEQYPEISAQFKNETSRNRLIEVIQDTLTKRPKAKMRQIVAEIELSYTLS